jgi:hypothetical protein
VVLIILLRDSIAMNSSYHPLPWPVKAVEQCTGDLRSIGIFTPGKGFYDPPAETKAGARQRLQPCFRTTAIHGTQDTEHLRSNRCVGFKRKLLPYLGKEFRYASMRSYTYKVALGFEVSFLVDSHVDSSATVTDGVALKSDRGLSSISHAVSLFHKEVAFSVGGQQHEESAKADERVV